MGTGVGCIVSVTVGAADNNNDDQNINNFSHCLHPRRSGEQPSLSERKEWPGAAEGDVQHHPAWSSLHPLKKDEKYARKKAKYYKKLLGHKGEHRVANTKHDQDDFTLQDLSLTPALKMHKITKNYNKMMKTESLKPHNKKLYKKLLKKEKFKKMKLQKKKQNKKNSQIP